MYWRVSLLVLCIVLFVWSKMRLVYSVFLLFVLSFLPRWNSLLTNSELICNKQNYTLTKFKSELCICRLFFFWWTFFSFYWSNALRCAMSIGVANVTFWRVAASAQFNASAHTRIENGHENGKWKRCTIRSTRWIRIQFHTHRHAHILTPFYKLYMTMANQIRMKNNINSYMEIQLWIYIQRRINSNWIFKMSTTRFHFIFFGGFFPTERIFTEWYNS